MFALQNRKCGESKDHMVSKLGYSTRLHLGLFYVVTAEYNMVHDLERKRTLWSCGDEEVISGVQLHKGLKPGPSH